MTKKETIKRYILFIISLFFTALGVAFTKHAELGLSPVTTIANVFSIRFPMLSIGTWLTTVCWILIILQILILRKNFKPVLLLQFPLTYLFGWFTDLGMLIVKHIPADSYPMRLLLVIIGVIILAFGISLGVIANVIMNAGEAFVKAVADTTKKNFGNVKTVFDISCVSFSAIMSLLFFDFTIVGIREGTLIAAVFTGMFVKLYVKLLNRPISKILIK